jgi:hypothetical protein
LSAGTTIVLIAETNNFAVSSWVENMNFVEIIAYGLLLFFITFNRSLFLEPGELLELLLLKGWFKTYSQNDFY